MTSPDPAPVRRRSRALFCGLVVVLALVPLYVRALVESSSALCRAREHLAATEPDERAAIDAFREAAEWYAPLNPYSRQAAEELFDLGTGDDPERDEATRLMALESLRTAAMVTRSLWTPYSDLLAETEARIASYRALDWTTHHEGAQLEVETTRQLVLLQRSRLREPDRFWSLWVCVCFVAWIAVTFVLIARSLDPSGRVKRRPLVLYGSLMGLLLVGWVLGLTQV